MPNESLEFKALIPNLTIMKRWHYAAILLGLLIWCSSCRNDEGEAEFETLNPVENEQQ
jgi:hypothetical protein